MTVDEQDPAVLRLRRETGSVLVAAPAADSVLRRVHERRRVQRQHRIQVVAALSVVLVAVAGALIATQGWTSEPELPSASRPIAEWPVRGSLADDADLIARAERTWRASPQRPSGAVRPCSRGRRRTRAPRTSRWWRWRPPRGRSPSSRLRSPRWRGRSTCRRCCCARCHRCRGPSPRSGSSPSARTGATPRRVWRSRWPPPGCPVRR
ncbi:hypothetical protein ACFQV2_35820 [Actinokineospora soli]|uniref:Uncharacterized protein n=1 Tax=Actinokineospora soli TaxID=1048753 RepID=A0ABW2TX81_9PSEU